MNDTERIEKFLGIVDMEDDSHITWLKRYKRKARRRKFFQKWLCGIDISLEIKWIKCKRYFSFKMLNLALNLTK